MGSSTGIVERRGAGSAEPVDAGGTPALFAGDEAAARRFWEFFAVTIRNPNTRRAYLTAVRGFDEWCLRYGIALATIEPMVVAAYIEDLTRLRAPATVKQHLAAIRSLFDWLVLGRVVGFNPAAAVRGPRHVVKGGKTPVLSAEETRELLGSIETDNAVGLRDRALIGVMVFSFARISAAVGMRVRDYRTQGRRAFFRLAEKGGRHNEVPAHHTAAEYVDAYLAALEDAGRDAPLFRAAVGIGELGERPLTRKHALRMVKRRARASGLSEDVSPHSFRATGITEYLRGGGDRDTAARIAGHESTRTTRLYDRRDDELTLDEIERIRI